MSTPLVTTVTLGNSERYSAKKYDVDDESKKIMSPSCTILSAFIAISRFSRAFVCFLVKNYMPDSSSFIDFTPP